MGGGNFTTPHHLTRQPALYVLSLIDTDLPVVQPLYFHTPIIAGALSLSNYMSAAIDSQGFYGVYCIIEMVKIRLRRMGAKKKPAYRLVVADARAPRDGAFIAIIGHYNPLTDPETVVIDEEKALNWLREGAQPTATAARLLSKAGIMEKFKETKEQT